MMEKRAWLRASERAVILRSLAHPLRLRLVEILTRGERCVNELVQSTGSGLPLVSHHLSILRAAAVVRARKEGLRVFYHLRKEDLLGTLASVERILEGRTRVLKTLCRSSGQRPGQDSRLSRRSQGG